MWDLVMVQFLSDLLILLFLWFGRRECRGWMLVRVL